MTAALALNELQRRLLSSLAFVLRQILWDTAGILQTRAQSNDSKYWDITKAATTLKAGITQSFSELQMNKPFKFIVIVFIREFIVFISIVCRIFIKTFPIVPSSKKEVSHLDEIY